MIAPRDIAPIIDHTVLSPLTTHDDIDKITDEAKEYRFASVCVPGRFVSYAVERLKGTGIDVATVVNFSLANDDPKAVAYAAKLAIEQGAAEVDMVANATLVGTDAYKQNIYAVAEAVKEAGGKMLKVIIEAGYLTPGQVSKAAQAVVDVSREVEGIKYMVKTSTGFAMNKLLVAKYDGTKCKGARAEDLERMYAVTKGTGVGLKASGGIGTFEDAGKMLYAMGVTDSSLIDPLLHRIGASKGIEIVSDK